MAVDYDVVIVGGSRWTLPLLQSNWEPPVEPPPRDKGEQNSICSARSAHASRFYPNRQLTQQLSDAGYWYSLFTRRCRTELQYICSVSRGRAEKVVSNPEEQNSPTVLAE